MRIKHLKAHVLKILEDIPESRDSDVRLTLEVWRRFYSKYIIVGAQSGTEVVKLTSLFELPREDNVKRVRAHIQNVEHLFLPTTWAVAKKRKINEDKWRAAMGYPPRYARGIDMGL